MTAWIESLSKLGIVMLSTSTSLLIGFLGYWVKNIIAHKDRTYERNIVLRQKYEEFGELMGQLFEEHHEFLQMPVKELSLFHLPRHPTGTRLIILAAIYFKNLVSDTKTYSKTMAKAQIDIAKAVNESKTRIDDETTVKEALIYLENYNEVHKPFFNAKNKLNFKFEKNAHRYSFLND